MRTYSLPRILDRPFLERSIAGTTKRPDPASERARARNLVLLIGRLGARLARALRGTGKSCPQNPGESNHDYYSGRIDCGSR
jgi:hypothetical protein